MALAPQKLKDSDRRYSDLHLIQQRANQERDRQLAALDWIERVLDVQLPKDAWAALGDGVVLCKLMVALYPHTTFIKKFNPPNSRRLLLIENLKYFLDACRAKEVGLDKQDLFDPLDLLDGKNVSAVVTVVKRLAVKAAERGLDVEWREGPASKQSAPLDTATELDAIRARNKFKLKESGGDNKSAPAADSTKASPRDTPSSASIIARLEAESANDTGKNTALHLAVKAHAVIDVLSDPKHVDDLTKVNAKRQTALHLAAMAGDFEAVQALLIAGANVNVVDDDGKTALHYATESNDSESVQALIDKGAQLDVQDKKKNTPLHLAARKGQKYSTLRLIKAGAALNIVNDSNESPIQLATDGDHRGIIEVMVDYGAKLDVARSGDGWTPLYTAAYQGVLETVELFLKNKAGPDAKNADGWTPLHAAAERGHLEVIQLLVKDYKAKVNTVNKQGTTPLYHAVTANQKPVVAFLLKHGADVNLGKKGGWKPLHSACRKASVEIVKLLVEYGAELDEVNEELKGYTPLMIAVARGKSATDTIEYLLSEGTDIDKPAANGATALHLAAYWGSLEIAKLLVDRGASMTAKNMRGLTPLDQAATFGFADVSKYLSDKSGVPVPKVKVSKQPKKADAVVPDAVPTPETLAAK